MRFALIIGGLVVNVIEQPAPPTIPGQWIDCTGQHVGPGYGWNGVAFTPPSAPAIVLSQRAFWRRFTAAEREALQNVLATGTQVQKNKLNALRDYIATGGRVELDDAYLVTAVTLMETVGVLAAGRAAVILTAPIAANES